MNGTNCTTEHAVSATQRCSLEQEHLGIETLRWSAHSQEMFIRLEQQQAGVQTMKGRISSLKLSYSPPGRKRSGRQLSGCCQLLCTACKQQAR